jgi:exo-beta-1,3-glucanase (GH17 family)
MWVAITVSVVALVFTIVCLIIVLPSKSKPAASSSNGGYSDNIPDASGIGVCYGAINPSHEDMVADFQKIKDKGFSVIRTYFPAFYGIPITDAAAEVGIKVLLGWPWKDQYADTYKQQIIDAVTTYPDTVWGVCVGNEDTSTESEATLLISTANELKSAISGKVPVGTAQKSDQVLDSLNALDFVGVNIYPYFSSTAAGWSQDADANANSLNSQISDMKDRFGDKLVITESGLPSAGPGVATPSGGTADFTKDIQEKFYDAVKSVKDVQIFWFEAFDESYKTGLETEKYYGIF